MKLFVWEGVLTDYTSGIICVLAKNEKQAWEMIYEEDNTAWWVLQGSPTIEGGRDYGTTAHDNLPKEGYFPTAIRPRIVSKPEAFIVWGGG